MSGDFRAPGWLARHPIAPILMVVLGGLVFGLMAYELRTHGPLYQLDLALAQHYHTAAQQASPGFVEIMTFGFFLGKEMNELIGAILIIYFLHKRFWPELGMVIIGWSGGAGLWFLLTSYFARPRPEPQLGIPVHFYSFPSGHTMQGVLCFGMLGYFLIPKMPSLFWKWAIAIGAAATVLFIGYSRLFEGGHYTSDLIAGAALGIAWAGLVYGLLETFVIRRRT
jgi:membrane-associated phospholipid phosphatase